MVMKPEVVLDLEALRAIADHSKQIERQLVLLFIGTAETSLVRIQWLVVHGNRREWQSVLHELRAASAHIHAKELAALCRNSVDVADDAVSRMRAYMQIKEAYEGLLMYLRNARVLTHTAQGD
jgi:hypothetical protein